MDKIVYRPETYIDENGDVETIVCVKEYEIYVEDGYVKYAYLEGGCEGGSKTIARSAQEIGDIVSIIYDFGGITCNNSHEFRASCSQQFAYALYMYLLTLKGKKLPEEDAKRFYIKELSIEESKRIEKIIKKEDKAYTKKNKFNKF